MPDLTRRAFLRSALVAAAGGVAAAATPAWLRTPTATAAEHLALTNLTVLDTRGGPSRPATTVLIRGHDIVAVGGSSQTPIPDGAAIVDMTGKYLIPGLCDMHVHSPPDERIAPPLYLANGVTTVREMAGDALYHGWRRQIDAGSLLGPRWVIGSQIIDGAPSIGDPDWEVAGVAAARRAIDRARQDDADFIKIYSRLSPELFHAIAAEAGRHRIPFAGHCPDAVSLLHASDAGQASVEHLWSTSYIASTREPEIRRALAKLSIDRQDYLTWLSEIHRLEWIAANSQSATKASRSFARLARNQTRIVPTLTVYRVLDRPSQIPLDDDRLKYVPPASAASWPHTLTFLESVRSPQEAAQWHALLDHRLAFVDALDRAGVPVLAGTDAGDIPFTFPGFSLHDELALLVEAGFTPMRALQAATIEPARFLGLDGTLGSIERGRVADLVVLDADPLLDIRNTTRIHAVVARGTLISEADRARLLAEAERAAQMSTVQTRTPLWANSTVRRVV